MKCHRVAKKDSNEVLGVFWGCDDRDDALEALESEAATLDYAAEPDELKVEEALVLVVLVKGGDAQSSQDAIALDLDRGQVRDHEWAALVSLQSLCAFIHNSGAELIRAEPWTGERFGDRWSGAIEIEDGDLVVGEGSCYRAERILEQLFE